MTIARAERIADAVLTEGYALYPYRATALKNRYRWQFGVVAPPAWATTPGGDPSQVHSELVVRAEDGASVTAVCRAFQVERRDVHAPDGAPLDELEVAGRRYVTWEEGHARREVASVQLGATPSSTTTTWRWGAHDETVEVRDRDAVVGRVRRVLHAVDGELALTATPVGEGLWRCRVTVTNRTAGAVPPDRAAAARRSAVSTHVVVGVDGGTVSSAATPTDDVAEAVRACSHEVLWPALVGGSPWATTALCAPLVLEDDPAVAQESTTDLFDATEIEELLALRIATLTPAEQAAAAATDDRVAAALARYLDPAATAPLHARLVPTDQLRASHRGSGTTAEHTGPAPGTRVVLRPRGDADVQDRFLAGRTATVVEVRQDLDGVAHVAVRVDDDPGADLRDEVGRHHHFRLEEVEPL